MTTAICAAVIHVALTVAATGTSEADTYAEAHRAMSQTDKPMVVMIGTDWCGPCQTMKNRVLPRLRKRGLFKKVAFAVVNPDRQRKLARRITGGGPIPQLIMYRKTSNGWLRRKLVGVQSEDAVARFINEGLGADEEEKAASANRT